MAKQLDYIKKLVDAKNTIIEQKNAVISDLQLQRAECLREINFLNNKLKEQSPLIDMDKMKGANQWAKLYLVSVPSVKRSLENATTAEQAEKSMPPILLN